MKWKKVLPGCKGIILLLLVSSVAAKIPNPSDSCSFLGDLLFLSENLETFLFVLTFLKFYYAESGTVSIFIHSSGHLMSPFKINSCPLVLGNLLELFCWSSYCISFLESIIICVLSLLTEQVHLLKMFSIFLILLTSYGILKLICQTLSFFVSVITFSIFKSSFSGFDFLPFFFIMPC